MIELRWLKRETAVLDNSSGIIGEPYPILKTTVRVLQFREQRVVYRPVGASDGNTYTTHYGSQGLEWSEWKDVPEASEA